MFELQKSISSALIPIFKRISAGSSAGLRMAPLIDVIFLLLIFFFVTLGLAPARSFLPMSIQSTGRASAAAIVEPMVIKVEKAPAGCRIVFAEKRAVDISDDNISHDLLTAAHTLRRVMSAQNRTVADAVELAFGDSVKWDHTVKIYNLLCGLGIEDITFRLNK